MTFIPKKTKNKVATTYKTLYIKEELCEIIDKIAFENDTSFNNVVISIIEEFIKSNNYDKEKVTNK